VVDTDSMSIRNSNTSALGALSSSKKLRELVKSLLHNYPTVSAFLLSRRLL